MMWKEIIAKRNPNSVFYPPAPRNQLEDIEKTFGIALPDELKNFFGETDGVTDVFGLGIVWSSERIKNDNLSIRNDSQYSKIFMPFDNLLFFADAGNGDLFAFAVIQKEIRTSNIFAWNHEDDSRFWVTPSMEKYLEWWLEGKIKL